MSKEFMAVIIDPKKRTVVDEVVQASLQEWYRIIGCDQVQIVTIPLAVGNIMMIVDEEGLFKEELEQFTFADHDMQQFAGTAILCNYEEVEDDDDDFGVEDHMTLTADDIGPLVEWCDEKELLS